MNQYPNCPTDISNMESIQAVVVWLRQVAGVANRVNSGKFNAVGTVTLTANTTTTNVIDPRINMFSFIQFDPLTANAAAALPTTYVAQVDRIKGQMTITHANNAQTDRTYNYLIVG